MGSSKFDIAKIRSTNAYLADQEDYLGINNLIDLSQNGFQKFEYLKDSVYQNTINLRFVNNNCIRAKKNTVQITLSDDKLYKGRIVLKYDDYNKMIDQYNELLNLVPKEYYYKIPFEIKDRKTHEKTGLGFWFATNETPELDDKINQISISYNFDFKLIYDKEKPN